MPAKIAARLVFDFRGPGVSWFLEGRIAVLGVGFDYQLSVSCFCPNSDITASEEERATLCLSNTR